MADEAKFSVRLIDRVKVPARAVSKALGNVKARVDGVSKVVGKVAKKDIRRFTKQGTRTRKVLGTLGPQLDKTFGTSLRKGTSVAGQRATAMWKQVAGGHLAAQAISRVASLGAAAAGAGWDFVTFGQRSELALGQLGKQGATGAKLFELGRTLAMKFGQDVEDTTVNLQKLLSAQFDARLATDIIKMGADLRAIGATAEDTSGAVRAITQIKGAGKLMGQELLQLANAGVSINLVREEIGKLMGGKSGAEVLKLQEAGQVDADTAIAGILNAVQKKTGSKHLGEAGAKFADTTIDGMLGRVKAVGQNAALEVTKRLEEPITKFIGGKAKRFTEWLESPKGAATIEMLGRGLEKALGLFEAIADTAGDTFLHVMTAVGDVVGPVFKTLGSEGAVATEVARTLGKVLGFVASALVVAGGLVLGFASASMFVSGAIWEGAIAAFEWLIEKLGAASVWFDDLRAQLGKIDFGDVAMAIGKSIVRGIAMGISSMLGLPIQAVEQLGSAVVGKLKGLLGIRSPSRVFAALGADTTSGFAIGIERGERSVQAAGHGLATAHLGGFSAGLTTGTGLGSPVASPGGFDLGGSTSAFDFGDLTSAAMPAPALDSSQVGGGRGPIRVDLHTEVHAGSGDADEIARLSARSSRRELEDFFRELDMET